MLQLNELRNSYGGIFSNFQFDSKTIIGSRQSCCVLSPRELKPKA